MPGEAMRRKLTAFAACVLAVVCAARSPAAEPPSRPVRLIVAPKANPGKLNSASSGHGLAAHLAGELFKAEAKIDLVHVPYKGAAPALQDVIAGHVQLMFATASSVVPHIREGKVRALAVTT